MHQELRDERHDIKCKFMDLGVTKNFFFFFWMVKFVITNLGVTKMRLLELKITYDHSLLHVNICGQRGFELDIRSRIGSTWAKWRLASRVLSDWSASLIKRSFLAVRQTLLHRIKCWAMKKPKEVKAHVAEIHMLKWMCGKDRGRNEYIKWNLQTAPIEDEIKECHFSFGLDICTKGQNQFQFGVRKWYSLQLKSPKN